MPYNFFSEFSESVMDSIKANQTNKKSATRYILLFLCITVILTPGFFENRWNIVKTEEYVHWQKGWESLIIARLVKSRQDGIFSAGGLSGIGDATEWDLGNKSIAHQYEVYEDGGTFEIYFAYKSFPGFQGFLFSAFDALTNLPPGWNIKLFRGMVAVFNAVVLALLAIGLFVEFGWIASALVVIYIILSKWFVLPAGNIYWNLWSFYLSGVINMFFLALVAKKDIYPRSKMLWVIFITSLVKILFSGFEFITTQLVMTTVPFVYFSVRDDWGLKVVSKRLFQVGVTLFAAVATGLLILMLQIFAFEGSFSGATTHLRNTISRRTIGNPEALSGIYIESMQVSVLSVIWKYLNIPALSFTLLGWNWQITFLHLIILFAAFTGFFVFRSKTMHLSTFTKRGKALMVATWFSIFAPLSWLIIFKPHSYFHTFLNPIVWQMPFTLLGLAFCGLVLYNLKIKV